MKTPLTVRGKIAYHKTGSDSHRVNCGISAKLQLANFKKPQNSSHNHDLNVAHHIADGTSQFEVRYVLMDYERNAQLKAKMMTRLEAWRRNKVLKGTGFAWAMCSR